MKKTAKKSTKKAKKSFSLKEKLIMLICCVAITGSGVTIATYAAMTWDAPNFSDASNAELYGEPGCRDSDGGKNIFTKGFTYDKGANRPFTDTCLDSNTVMEHWCDANGRLAGGPIDCPKGYHCFDGACTNNIDPSWSPGLDLPGSTSTPTSTLHLERSTSSTSTKP